MVYLVQNNGFVSAIIVIRHSTRVKSWNSHSYKWCGFFTIVKKATTIGENWKHVHRVIYRTDNSMFAILESKRKIYLFNRCLTLPAAMASPVFCSKHNNYVTENNNDIIVRVIRIIIEFVRWQPTINIMSFLCLFSLNNFHTNLLIIFFFFKHDVVGKLIIHIDNTCISVLEK